MKRRRSSPDQGGPSSTWHGNIASGSARVHNGHHYGDATYNITYSGAAPSSLRDQTLDSLWFDMMEARQDNIKGATPDTLDWVYDPQESTSKNHEGPQWDSLRMWLEEGDSIYWVCGKAGSGKSTLMAHIVDDDRTLDRLSHWAKGQSLHILKFFFWRPGTELQKSVTGLLRALLYQLCTEMEDAIPQVVKALRWSPTRRAPWSDKRLSLAIEAALTSSHDVFCLFLDGLDEFVDDLSTLMDFVYRLEALQNVKLCVSSRPEVEITANFSSCKQLRLEHLNRADIEKVVEKQLCHFMQKPVFSIHGYERYHDFVRDVAYRADGVFLWAVLILPALVKGISSGDDWNMLQVRLGATPTRSTTSMRPSIAQITAAQLGKDLLSMSHDDFFRACDLERSRIIGRTVGLMQISQNRLSGDVVGSVVIPHLLPHDGKPAEHICSARDAAKLRIPMALSARHAEAHIRAIEDIVEWTHRSAHDFVFPPDGSVSLVCDSHLGCATVRKKFLLGGVNSLAVLPSFAVRDEQLRRQFTTSRKRLTDLNLITNQLTRTETGTALEIADELRLVVCNMHNEDVHRSHLLPYAREELDSSLDAFPFWIECFSSEAWPLIEALLPVLLSEPAGNALFMPMWNEIAQYWCFTVLPEASVELVIMPFLRQIEQNIWLPGEASARDILYFHDVGSYEDRHRYRRHCSRLRHLSCKVPDFLGPRQPAAMHRFFLQYLEWNRGSCPEVVLAYLDRIAKSICLFADIEIQPQRSYFELNRAYRYRVLLQCSHQLRRWFDSGAEALNHDPKYCDEFRVVCLPAGGWIRDDDGSESVEPDNTKYAQYGETTRFIHFAPSSRTCLCLVQAIKQARNESCDGRFELSVATMLHHWTQLLVDDIWENAQGLDATQQLFALACVKWTIPRWLGCTNNFSVDLWSPL